MSARTSASHTFVVATRDHPVTHVLRARARRDTFSVADRGGDSIGAESGNMGSNTGTAPTDSGRVAPFDAASITAGSGASMQIVDYVR